MTTRNTGLRGPDRDETRKQQLADAHRPENVIVPPIVVQPILRIRDQPELPNCVGESSAAAFHAATGYDASGRDVWREAQFQEAKTFDPTDGALLEYAVQGMIERGLRPYRPGEEYDTSSALETWVEGEEAWDMRQLGMVHQRVDVSDLESLYVALASGSAVFDGGGVTSKFMGRTLAKANTPADLDELGGDRNGHAQRIAAYWLGATLNGVKVGDIILYQGSWSEDFAGCYVPELDANGNVARMVLRRGCFWAKTRTFAQRWDAHSFRPSVTA